MQSVSKFQQQFSQKWIKNPEICMETQGMLNNPSHPGEEEQGWGYHAP